ncbi:phosphoribosylaminoimidazole succinocarboxamide synthase [Bdellovibrio sp. SKB1291214]|uniref:phosphoribosylaminoimidazolesuccinocarboxamide synthase n=1 Tax=Bdellovibrio sp. SKB1291214 TaxID=1732569 RepID=UPI000B51B2F4|nr:phosphoribosylaminoimidazolesuccinocarboxamide synthase [Bdellovibrio sp. SKB1291214]UYL08440.1 phosphoribosylaminoimidazole succinocarboxamide synthase [Bdellovibrio sp. SKB1291214]
MNLLYRGSVKDIYKTDAGLLFKYSNRYSVFDWGEMPNEIPQKGEALAAMAGMFFEHLKDKGIESHYMKPHSADSILVNEVAVHRPIWENGVYDYTVYADKPTNCLVPLEVIFRILLGKGNSLEGRLKKNPAYMAELGLTEIPDSSKTFMPPIVEYSTKLETTDRYMTNKEIQDLNVIDANELAQVRKMTEEVAKHLQSLFASFGVKLWDGKFEFAFGGRGENGRELFMVDSIGPDELRLTYENAPLSKEFLRQIYAPTTWYQAVGKAKDIAKERGANNWKEICAHELKEVPQVLNPEQIKVASMLYTSLANEMAWSLGKTAPFEKEASLKNWRQQCASWL